MKLKTFQGSLWKSAEEEQQRALQQAQDALNALTPEEIARMRALLMTWTRLMEMSVSEFIGCVLDKRLAAQAAAALAAAIDGRRRIGHAGIGRTFEQAVVTPAGRGAFQTGGGVCPGNRCQ